MFKYIDVEKISGIDDVCFVHYFYDTVTDVMYIRERPDKGAFSPMPKASGGYLTYEEWEIARRKNGRYVGDILIPNFKNPRFV